MQRSNFDRTYIERIVAGDAATERHFAKYFGDLLTLKLRRRLRSPLLVEDAKQETLLRVLSTLKTGRGIAAPEKLGSFVNAVCENVLLEMYRADARVPLMSRETPDLPDAGAIDMDFRLATEQERGLVRDVIDALPAKDREILIGLFLDERDRDELCQKLGVDRNYLRLLLHRAKARFRADFERRGARR